MSALFDTATLTRRGGRETNQDCLGFRDSPLPACWVLADGLGGHRAGDAAARLAVDTVLGSIGRTAPPQAFSVGIGAAQVELARQQEVQSELYGMRTTVVGLLIDSEGARWAHVGDSRLYLFRGGRLVAKTRDHSVVQALHDAQSLQGGGENRNRLTRVLGEIGESADQLIEISGDPIGVEAGDTFLLCSDGFWEEIDEIEMEIDLAKSARTSDWLRLMEARLIPRMKPDHDNYSAVAVRVLRQVGAPTPLPTLGAGNETEAAPSAATGRDPWVRPLAGIASVLALALALLFLIPRLTPSSAPVTEDLPINPVAVKVDAQDLKPYAGPAAPNPPPQKDEEDTSEVTTPAEETEEAPEPPAISPPSVSPPVQREPIDQEREPIDQERQQASPPDDDQERSQETTEGQAPEESSRASETTVETEVALANDPEAVDGTAQDNPPESSGDTEDKVDSTGEEAQAPINQAQDDPAAVETPDNTPPEDTEASTPDATDAGAAGAKPDKGRSTDRKAGRSGRGYVWVPAEGDEPGFWIGMTEVVVKAFKDYQRERPAAQLTTQPEGIGDPELRPLTNVPPEMAERFCEWDAAGRLPTASEWRRAALAGFPNAKYPWPESLEPTCVHGPSGAVFDDCNPKALRETAQFRPNNFNLFDMAGNAAELVLVDPGAAKYAALGGSWKSDAKELTIADDGIGNFRVRNGHETAGFRCIVIGWRD